MTTASLADTVYLKNGRTLDGLVVSQSDTDIELDMGLSRVTVKRSQVEAIARSVTEENTRLRDEWSERYITRGKFTPPGYRALADEFHAIERAHRDASAAHTSIRTHRRHQPRRLEQRRDLERQLVAINEELARTRPEDNPHAYNDIVERNNALRARILVLQNQTVKTEGEIGEDMVRIADYIRSFDTFREKFDEAHASFAVSEASKTETVFFDTVLARLESLDNQFRENHIPHETRFGHLFMEAEINGRGTAHLMFDTGASVVTLSDVAARRLGVKLTGQKKAELRMADGSVVEAETVMLDSVQVGDARVENVLAAILPARYTDDKDGLLGMTFLREFIIHYDASRGDLVLRQFAP